MHDLTGDLLFFLIIVMIAGAFIATPIIVATRLGRVVERLDSLLGWARRSEWLVGKVNQRLDRLLSLNEQLLEELRARPGAQRAEGGAPAPAPETAGAPAAAEAPEATPPPAAKTVTLPTDKTVAMPAPGATTAAVPASAAPGPCPAPPGRGETLPAPAPEDADAAIAPAAYALPSAPEVLAPAPAAETYLGMFESRDPDVLAPAPAAEAGATPAPAAARASAEAPDGGLDRRTAGALERILNWLVVGEEHRAPGVSAEFAVATTWLIRAGVLILLFGIGFFVKYSIDNDLVSPAARVLTGAALGLAMVLGGWRGSRRQYRAVALGVMGGGVVALYLAIYGGFRLYDLIPRAHAFALMVTVTAGAMFLSLRANAMLPALIGCLGGYATPALLSDNSGNLPALFTYMLIISVGILAISAWRQWRLLTWSAFALSSLLAAAALWDAHPARHYLTSMGYLAANFAVFLGAAILAVWRRPGAGEAAETVGDAAAPAPLAQRRGAPADPRQTTLLDILLVLADVVFFLVAAMPLAARRSDPWHLDAWAAVFAAVACLAGRRLVQRWRPDETAFATTLEGAAAVSLFVAAPLYFSGAALAAAWSGLALALSVIGARHGNRLLLWLGRLTFVAAFVPCALAMPDASLPYLQGARERLLSRWALTVALIATAWEFRRAAARPLPAEAARLLAPAFFTAAAIAAFFVVSTWEIEAALGAYAPAFQAGAVSLWWGLFAFVMLWQGLRRGSAALRGVALALFVVCAGKVFFHDLENLKALYRVLAFSGLGVILLVGAVFYIRFRDRFKQ